MGSTANLSVNGVSCSLFEAIFPLNGYNIGNNIEAGGKESALRSHQFIRALIYSSLADIKTE